MTNIELIDRLCGLVESQAAIIREQAFFIEQILCVDEEVKKKFADLRKPTEGEFDEISSYIGPFRGFTCGKE